MPQENTGKAGELLLAPATNLLAPLSSPIQVFIDSLVDRYQETNQDVTKLIPAGRDLAGRDLTLFDAWLSEAHRYFRNAAQKDISLTYASEWILDNYYIIRRALQQIHEDLPRGFYIKLPRLARGPLKDFPRIFAIAEEILTYQHVLLNPIDIQTILIQFQNRVPLTMGELWALPIFLRYSLIETLAHTLVHVIHPTNPPNLPPPSAQLIKNAAAGSVSTTPGVENTTPAASVSSEIVANIILSLRTVSEQDWNDFFENVSCTEQLLREDPAGIYPQMDFKTRDMYRKEIEKLSFAVSISEDRLAEMILDLVRRELGDTQREEKRLPSNQEHPSTHIGWYLLGQGRSELENLTGYRPRAKTRLLAWGRRHAGPIYLGSILLATIVLDGSGPRLRDILFIPPG